MRTATPRPVISPHNVKNHFPHVKDQSVPGLAPNLLIHFTLRPEASDHQKIGQDARAEWCESSMGSGFRLCTTCLPSFSWFAGATAVARPRKWYETHAAAVGAGRGESFVFSGSFEVRSDAGLRIAGLSPLVPVEIERVGVGARSRRDRIKVVDGYVTAHLIIHSDRPEGVREALNEA
jgi:hypothetical protein